MAEKNILEVIITGKDEASGKLSGILGTLGGLGKTAGIVGGALGVAGGAVVKFAGDLATSAAPAEAVTNTFKNLAASIGEEAAPMLEQLRQATRGMVADTDLMQATNKFMSMGLADSSEEAAKLAEMATQLGSAMGLDATTAMGDFAMMLSNQAIPRLDNFGISSGQVRERIDELMAADQNLTREQAFMQAVMEQGETSMAKIGEQSGTTAASMAQVQAQLENLKISIGTALLPILGELAKAVTPLIQEIGPVLVDVAGQVGGVITSDVIPALLPLIEKLLPPILDLLPSIVSLFALLASNLMEALAPVLDTLVLVLIDLIDQFTPLLETLLPPLIDLIGSLMKIVEPILTIATSLLSNIVIPLIELLLPPLIDLLDKVVGVVSTLAGWLADHLQPAFDAIGDAISNVIGWFESLKDKLSNIHLPDWLTPGSPTPFELGLRGIASALKEVNGDIGGLTVNASSPSTMQPIMVSVNITDQSYISLSDIDNAEARLKPIVTNIVRKAMAS